MASTVAAPCRSPGSLRSARDRPSRRPGASATSGSGGSPAGRSRRSAPRPPGSAGAPASGRARSVVGPELPLRPARSTARPGCPAVRPSHARRWPPGIPMRMHRAQVQRQRHLGAAGGQPCPRRRFRPTRSAPMRPAAAAGADVRRHLRCSAGAQPAALRVPPPHQRLQRDEPPVGWSAWLHSSSNSPGSRPARPVPELSSPLTAAPMPSV